MTTPSGPSHRNVTSIRSPTSALPGAPTSPHTPLRTIQSAFGSPSSLRAEEDCIILELGSRYLRAGFAGDALPKAVIDFGPEEQRRAGDYRRWAVDYDKSHRHRLQEKDWGEAHELWKPDLRGLDLGLVGDKIDRAVLEAFTKYLLVDSRPRRMALAIPSTLATPLLSTLLDTLFTSFQPPTISLMSAPVTTTFAAGLRSALVIDIGWAETVVTGVYEYREVGCTRSIRAAKMLGEATFKMLAEAIDALQGRRKSRKHKPEEDTRIYPCFEECEEVSVRMGYCKGMKRTDAKAYVQGLTPVKEEDEFRASMRSLNIGGNTEDEFEVSIPLQSADPPRTLLLPFSKLAEPCENSLFGAGIAEEDLDDEELPLHLLVYKSLLLLPVDVRTICMSRLVFTGGGSQIPGLKSRVLDEVAALIEQRGWDPVRGKALEQFRNNQQLQRTRRRPPGPTEISQDGFDAPTIPAGLQEQEPDPIEEQLKRESKKGQDPIESASLRAIDSLGAWSGVSMLSQLKVHAVSVVEREQWLQHGLTGAVKPGEIDHTKNRQSMGPGVFKPGGGERSSWTLGIWG